MSWLLHQLVEVPAIAPLFARGERNFDRLPQDRQIFVEGFGADRVLDEVAARDLRSGRSRGSRRRDRSAGGNRCTSRRSCRRLRAPATQSSYELIDALARVEGRVGRRVGRAHAEGAVAGRHGRGRALLQRSCPANAGNDAGGVVALAVIAHHAAENRVNRQLSALPLMSHSARSSAPIASHLLAAGRIEERARHVLPEPLDVAADPGR